MVRGRERPTVCLPELTKVQWCLSQIFGSFFAVMIRGEHTPVSMPPAYRSASLGFMTAPPEANRFCALARRCALRTSGATTFPALFMVPLRHRTRIHEYTGQGITSHTDSRVHRTGKHITHTRKKYIALREFPQKVHHWHLSLSTQSTARETKDRPPSFLEA